MKIINCVVMGALLMGLFTPLHAEDPVFTSLSRRATPTKRLPNTISIVTTEDIQRSGAVTLTDVLDQLPAVDVTRSGSLGQLATVRIRGVPTSNQVQIIVDDQPLGGVAIQSIDLSLIPVENIESIEVVRGGTSVLYGANTIGGVIHIKTKRQSDPTGSGKMSYEGGSFDTDIVTLQGGARTDQFDTYIYGQTFNTDGYQENSDVRNFNYSVNGGYSFSSGSRFGIDFSQFDQNQGTASGTPVPYHLWNGEREKQANTPTNRIAKSGDQTRAKISVPIQDVLFQTIGYRGFDDYQLDSTPAGPIITKFENLILGNDTRLLFPGGLTTGFSFEKDARKALGQADQDMGNWGVYAQDDYDLLSMIVTPGIRFDQNSEYGNEVTPRLSVVSPVNKNVKLSASAARTYRAPTLVELFIVAQEPGFSEFDFFGNPNLQPETGWTFDGGLEYLFGNSGVFNASGYFSQIQDRITAVDTTGNGNNNTLQNISVAELSGIELALGSQTGPMEHSTNYTFQRAVGTTATSSDYVPLRFTPKHLFNYINTLRLLDNSQLINRLQYVDEQYQNDGLTGLRIPSYWLWNVRLQKDFNQVNVFVQVNNITDNIYTESITFGNFVPQPTRNYQIGFSSLFPGQGDQTK